ncbi:cupin [Anaerobacillus alkalidiazotrophicus]|uniref:Cupin n=1 Tax=Anaerobacillus alkalidiazotrophicus TaxID=472963 RepID=A0A1S2M2X5_9BACI|nr:cupin domain-containing protein [Anaerobacillus alkalidiazotrophicus]OIJ19051.1 cupin [Anaerobacillus alkalidiazotrophicus]
MEIKSLSEYQEFSETSFKKQIIFQKQESVVFKLNFMPGQALPLHKHPGTQVYLLVLEGVGEVQLEEEKKKVTTGDVIHVDGDELFAFANTGDTKTSLYVFLNKIPDERYAKNI